MLEQLARNWWMLAVRGAAAIVFGLCAFAWPRLTLAVLVVLFGAYAVVEGALSIGTGIGTRKTYDRWWVLVLQGALGVAAGFIVFAMPRLTALTLVYVIAAWAIVTGVLQVIAAVRLHREIEHEWLLGLAGVASVVFGALLAARPGAGALALVWLIGGYAIAFGVLMIGVALELRNLPRRRRPVDRVTA